MKARRAPRRVPAAAAVAAAGVGGATATPGPLWSGC